MDEPRQRDPLQHEGPSIGERVLADLLMQVLAELQDVKKILWVQTNSDQREEYQRAQS